MEYYYQIEHKIRFVKCDCSGSDSPEILNNGSFGMTISENDAADISRCEQALLNTGFQAMRETMSEHLSAISVEKALSQIPSGCLTENTHPYKVDGEVGRFLFKTHTAVAQDGTEYNTAKDYFPGLKGKELFKTNGFKETAIIYGTVERSYRKSADMINRMRHQEGATPPRTLREITESEGLKLVRLMEDKSDNILNFIETFSDRRADDYNTEPAVLPEEEVRKAVEKCEEKLKEYDLNVTGKINENPVCYEDPEQTVNISDDDVVVKKQKEKRDCDETAENVQNEKDGNKKKRKYVHNTVVHVEKGGEKYILNGYSILSVLKILTAFLVNNDLLKYRLQFFTDGHTTLNKTIITWFSSWFKNIGIILDWYHLEKKLKQKLSLAMKGRNIRNKVLADILRLLWYGLTDDAIEYLRNIDESLIKNKAELEKLVEYLERNRPHIPCYAVRKELGLRNSSNIGEKMNDLVVSERQKHNGMSWSKSGSVAITTIKAVERNGEYKTWLETGDIEFKLAA